MNLKEFRKSRYLRVSELQPGEVLEIQVNPDDLECSPPVTSDVETFLDDWGYSMGSVAFREEDSQSKWLGVVHSNGAFLERIKCHA